MNQEKEWQRDLAVGKRGKYTFTPSKKWLGAATLVSVSATSTSGVSVESVTTNGSVVEVMLLGVSVGRQAVHFSYSASDSQSSCFSCAVNVRSC